jgi:hypothetical protein
VINTFFLHGEIKKINVSEPKDPTKNASAVMLVRYGVQREASGGPVEFVNAVMIRVPSYKYPTLRDKLSVGQKVVVTGHLQGVFKTALDEGYFTTELVADRISFADEKETSRD